MCSAPARDRGDLTAKAAIRDEALRLFAEHGPDAVSLRQVAAGAGVSPGLVAHHYGSKDGLRAAVDAHVAAVFDQMFTAIGTGGWDTAAGSSFAELIISALPANSPIPAYLRRLLTSGDAAAAALFAAWYAAGRTVLDQLDGAGLTRPSSDPDVRAAFLLINDLAVLLLRDHLTTILGVDPLTRDGMARWLDTALAVYRDGLFITEEDS